MIGQYGSIIECPQRQLMERQAAPSVCREALIYIACVIPAFLPEVSKAST